MTLGLVTVAYIAAAILFFCCGLSAHVTGTVLPVDGGAHDRNETSYQPALTEDAGVNA